MQALVDELDRRRTLDLAIERIIFSRYQLDPAGKVRKGAVQQLVMDRLGVRDNRRPAQRVKAVLAGHGVTEVFNRGRAFFRGLEEK